MGMRTLVLPVLVISSAALVVSSPAFAVDTTRETRTVASFHAISIETVADVDITIGPVTKVEVSAPKDWLGKLQTTVEHDSLHTRTPSVKGKAPTFKVSITTPSLDAIAVDGISNVHTGPLHDKKLALAVSGAATFDISGSADSLAIAVSGVAELKLKDLASRQAALEVSGIISGAVRANQAL